jgi:hypothetical protein
MWVMTSVETLGYYQESLRDEDEILVAIGAMPLTPRRH